MKNLIIILIVIILITSILPSIEIKEVTKEKKDGKVFNSTLKNKQNNSELSDKLILKDKLIKNKIRNKGYRYFVVRVSDYRTEKENELLALSAKNSYHLHGEAIDVIIGDINKDFKINLRDVDLFVSIVREVELENPSLIGGIGTYKSKGYAQQMVHFDTRGYNAYWNY